MVDVAADAVRPADDADHDLDGLSHGFSSGAGDPRRRRRPDPAEGVGASSGLGTGSATAGAATSGSAGRRGPLVHVDEVDPDLVAAGQGGR